MNGTSPGSMYFDNNATTALAPAALEAMLPFLRDCHANPSSPYDAGRFAAAALAEARECVAALASCAPSDVVFTSGGTESNNTALWSACRAFPERSRVVVSSIEHASVLRSAAQLAREGREVVLVRTDPGGSIDLADLGRSIDQRTAIVSVMTANNETGALQPVEEAARLAHRQGALFHTDAVQAAGKLSLEACASADFLSLSAHKLHGPKGVGALIVRPDTPFEPLLTGGDQERSRRAGTENVAGIAGFGKAASLASTPMDEAVRALRDGIEQRILASCPDALIAARASPRLPNTSCLLIPGVETETLLALLDMRGLCCSSGSACSASAHEPSHVLRAMGLPTGHGWGVLRISLSRQTRAAEADCLVEQVCDVVHHLRAGGAGR